MYERASVRVGFYHADTTHNLQTAPLDSVCSVLHVAKCHYCARVGETLKYVAEQYNFDTNWLRLWNYNYQLTDPVIVVFFTYFVSRISFAPPQLICATCPARVSDCAALVLACSLALPVLQLVLDTRRLARH